jgi:hypothetical protein
MGNAARKFFDRAPRYILHAGDEKIVRVAPRNRRKNQIYHLEILDVSETGMSFIVNWNYLPQIGEILKVEFPVPGENRKVAWFAKVMRMEGMGERPQEMNHFSGIKVGVEFIDMPKGHIRTLKAALNNKTQNRIRAHRLKKALQKRGEILRVMGQLIFLTAVCVGIYYFFKSYTEHDINYDPKRPVNWGERFFDRIKKEH